jgi:glucosamine-6-phosphate deaminase
MEKITIAKTETEFDEKASWYIIGQICGKPNSVIGLSTGRTTGNMHRLVVKQYKQQPFNVSRITFFGLDEVMNVPQEYAGACYTMLKTEIIDGLGIDDRHFLMLPTKSDNWERDCQRFRQELQRRGGIDLLILGLGENGHLGFNQPGTPFESEAWTSRMNPELEQRIRHETQTPEDVSLGGVTLGIKDIMHARRIVLVAKGKNKAEIVKQMLLGPISPDIPASVLQLHPNCDFLLDAGAAGLINV